MSGVEVGVGSVVSCAVSLVGGSEGSVSLTLTADTEQLEAASKRLQDKSVGFILPGMTIQGVVTTVS